MQFLARILLFPCLLSFFISYSHDINLALFEIFEEDNKLLLRIKFDRFDLLTALTEQQAANQFRWTERSSLSIMDRYLDKKLELTFDNRTSTIKTQKIKIEDEYVISECIIELQTSIEDVRKIELRNEALLEIVENQENIVTLDIKSRKRSFRLSKNLTNTTITY